MSRYLRILAVVDPLPAGQAVTRQAVALSRDHQARLLIGMPFDFHGGFAGDHVPFLTPNELRAQTKRRAWNDLGPLLHQLGANEREVEFRLLDGAPNRAVMETACAWQADLILANTALANRIQNRGLFGAWVTRPLPCDLLTVRQEPSWRLPSKPLWGLRCFLWG